MNSPSPSVSAAIRMVHRLRDATSDAFTLLAIGALCGSVALGADAPAERPLSDHLLALTSPTSGAASVALSPTGTRIAQVIRAGTKLEMHVIDLATGQTSSFPISDYEPEIEGRTRKDPVSITNVIWAADDRLAFGDSLGRVFFINPDGTAMQQFLPRGPSAPGTSLGNLFDYSELLRALPQEPGVVLVQGQFLQAGFGFEGGAFVNQSNLYYVDAYNAKFAPVVTARQVTGYPLVDQLGTLRGVFQSPTPRDWSNLLTTPDKEKFTSVDTLIEREELQSWGLRFRDETPRQRAALVLGFAYNPDILFFASNRERNTYAVFALDLKGGKVVGPVFDPKEYDVVDFDEMVHPNCLVFVPEKATVGGFRYEEEREQTSWRIPEFANIQYSLDQRNPGAVNCILGWSRDLQRFLIHTFTADDPGSVHLLDLAAGELRRIAVIAPELARDRLGTTITASVTTRDQQSILCYLSQPREDAGPSGRPLVVLLQEDAWERAHWRFDIKTEYLVANGFAVLRVNHRGRKGFGLEHFEAGRGRYVEAATADVVDAVNWAREQAGIDKTRTYLVGESFGGMLALNMLSAEPALFNAAAVTDPITNPEAFEKEQGHTALFDWIAANVQRSRPDRIVRDGRILRAMAPINNAERIRSAVLFVCRPDFQSQQAPAQTARMHRALQSNNTPAEIHLLEARANQYDRQRQELEATVEFLRRQATASPSVP